MNFNKDARKRKASQGLVLTNYSVFGHQSVTNLGWSPNSSCKGFCKRGLGREMYQGEGFPGYLLGWSSSPLFFRVFPFLLEFSGRAFVKKQGFAVLASPVFSERCQLSQAIPQFQVERMLHEGTPNRGATNAGCMRTDFCALGGRCDCQRALVIQIAAITLACDSANYRTISQIERPESFRQSPPSFLPSRLPRPLSQPAWAALSGASSLPSLFSGCSRLKVDPERRISLAMLLHLSGWQCLPNLRGYCLAKFVFCFNMFFTKHYEKYGIQHILQKKSQKVQGLLSGPSWPFVCCNKLGPDNNPYLAQIITPQNGIVCLFRIKNVLKYLILQCF